MSCPEAGLLPGQRQPPFGLPADGRRPAGVQPVLRWAFLLFVFSLPFELGNEKTIPFEPPTLFAGLFLLVAFLKPRFTFQRPPLAFWWFVLHVCIFILAFLLHGVVHEEVFYYRLTYFFLLLCQLLPTYQLMRYDGLAKEALVALILSSLVVTALLLLGVRSSAASQRATFLSQNPANLASILSIAMVALIGLVLRPEKLKSPFRYLAWPLFAVIGLAVIGTGTRTAVPAVTLGLFTFLFRPGGYWMKLRSLGLLMFLTGILLCLAQRSSLLVDRFEESVAGGNLAKREFLYPAAWQMFLEEPLLGWGPVQNDYEIQRRVQMPNKVFMEPHNLFLELLSGTGILGAIPFLTGIWLCLGGAWKARSGTHGILPLAVLVTALTTNMGMPWTYSKTFWLVLAYALARSSPLEGTVSSRALEGLGRSRNLKLPVLARGDHDSFVDRRGFRGGSLPQRGC